MSERLQRLKELLSRLQKPKMCLFLKVDNGSMYEIKADTIEPITEDELAEFKGMKVFVSFPTVHQYLEFTDSRLENLN